MPLEDDTRLRQRTRTAARVIDGRAVVIIIDQQELHTLNPTGTFLWEQTEQPRRVAELVDALTTKFDVSTDVARRDVLAFAETLLDLGALTVEEQE